MPISGEVRINGLVFINDKPAGQLKQQPPQPHTPRPATGADTRQTAANTVVPHGKPGQIICVFQGSGEAADVPKVPGQVGSGGHGRMVCYIDGKEVFNEPASNVTKPETNYKHMHKDWRSRRDEVNKSFPAPPGTYGMSKLEPSANFPRNVIHVGIKSRPGIEIHSMQRGNKFRWYDTDGCVRVQEESLRRLGDLLKDHPGQIIIKDGSK